MAVPAVLVPVEAIRVDGGCDHDAQACSQKGGGGGGSSERTVRKGDERTNRSLVYSQATNWKMPEMVNLFPLLRVKS